MQAHSLASIIMYSPNPERLADFYREVIGIPFDVSTHGGAIRPHLEGMFAGVHFAVWRTTVEHAPKDVGRSAFVPTFRVDDLAAFAQTLADRGHEALHPIVDLGEGKRLVSFADPDGNAFRLIQLH